MEGPCPSGPGLALLIGGTLCDEEDNNDEEANGPL